MPSASRPSRCAHVCRRIGVASAARISPAGDWTAGYIRACRADSIPGTSLCSWRTTNCQRDGPPAWCALRREVDDALHPGFVVARFVAGERVRTDAAERIREVLHVKWLDLVGFDDDL